MTFINPYPLLRDKDLSIGVELICIYDNDTTYYSWFGWTGTIIRIEPDDDPDRTVDYVFYLDQEEDDDRSAVMWGVDDLNADHGPVFTLRSNVSDKDLFAMRMSGRPPK